MKKIILKYLIIVLLLILFFLIVVFVNKRYQTSLLFEAIENDNYIAAQKSIKMGARINSRKHLLNLPELLLTNPTPLIEACKKGNKEIVDLLLQNGADVNKNDNFTGKTPLLAALHGKKKNRFSLAFHLIENGANIHITQKTTSPLEETLVVLESDDKTTIQEGFNLFQYLIQNNVDISICTGNENALTFSAHYNNYNVVKYLVENNYFDINSCDSSGDTALIVATKNNRPNIVALLITLGADRETQDLNKKTAYDYAVELGNNEIISLLSS